MSKEQAGRIMKEQKKVDAMREKKETHNITIPAIKTERKRS